MLDFTVSHVFHEIVHLSGIGLQVEQHFEFRRPVAEVDVAFGIFSTPSYMRIYFHLPWRILLERVVSSCVEAFRRDLLATRSARRRPMAVGWIHP